MKPPAAPNIPTVLLLKTIAGRRFADLYLQKYRRKFHSQFGEDGLLQYLVNVLYENGISLSRTTVEFGAWDGVYLSNTHFFAKAYGWKSVFIEGDSQKFLDLQKTIASLPNSIGVNRWVRDSGPDCLDSILGEILRDCDLDILSIDIDGDDYIVFENLQRYLPKIVVIEINFSVRPGVADVNEKGTPVVMGKSGTSITSIRELGQRKGYSLISVVGCNAILVRNEFFPYFYNHKVDEFDLFTYEGFASKDLALREKFARKVAKASRNMRLAK